MDQQTQSLERISTKQAAFLKEIMLKRKFMKIGLEESQMIKEKLDIFFSKQQTLQRNYNNLKGSKCEILNELHEILKLAEEYKVMAKNSDISKDFKKLENRFASLDTKRAEFSKELGCLRSTVSGKTKISITEAASVMMDYNGDAKSARINMPESVMTRSGKLGENIYDLKTVIDAVGGQ